MSARTAIYSISIDGNDVSSAFNPVLISLTISQTDGGSADSLELELDDSNGQIQLPRVGASISASLGWSDTGSVTSFEGYTDEPKSSGQKQSNESDDDESDASDDGKGMDLTSSGGRSKGRILTITAKSADMQGKIKQPLQAHADNKSFGDVAQEWGQKGGLSSVKVSGALASIQRTYWAIANESFMTWGARIAKELGATFKIFQGTAVFVPRSGGESASGQALTAINVTWGDNLLEWSIAPVLGRPDFKTLSVRWWDTIGAKWQNATAGNDESSSDVTHTDRFKAPDQDHAQQKADSNAAESKRDKGGADSVTIDGAPDAQSEAPCNVSGIRPGVDGAYTIKDVTHSLSRSGGFTTQLTLKQPSGGAGTDDRSDDAAADAG